jgi:hypothetical protein
MADMDFALHNAWNSIGTAWFKQNKKRTATADEVRVAVREALDASKSTIAILRWNPLADSQKTAALETAFPSTREYSDGEEEDRAYVIDQLQSFAADFQSIESLIVGDVLPREKKKQAQGQLKALKQRLADAVKWLQGDDLTKHEEAFLLPALESAKAEISVAWTSDPIRSRWLANLYGARLNITSMLSQIQGELVR